MEGRKQDADESKSTRHSKKPKSSTKQGHKGHGSREHSTVAKEAPRKKKKATASKRPESEVLSFATGGLSAIDAHPPETTERSGVGPAVGTKAHRHRSRGQKGDEAARDVASERGSNNDGIGAEHDARGTGSGKIPQAKPSASTLGSSVSPGNFSHPSSSDEPQAVAPGAQKGQPPPAESCGTENVGPASSKRHSLAERRKSSLALPAGEKALPEVIGAAELASQPNPVVVSTVSAAEPGHGARPRLGERSHSIASEGSAGVNLGRNLDVTTRSAYRRSQLRKANEAVIMRAAMDRRSSIALQKPGIARWSGKASIAIFSAICACAVLLLFLAVYTAHKRQAYKTCATPACVKFSRSLRESMNASVRPCDNFGNFVCDGWRRRYDMSVAEIAFVAELDSVGQTLLGVLKAAKQEQQDAMRKAAILYRSCNSVRQGIRDELNKVREVLRSEGIFWPHRSPKPNVLRTLLRSSLALRWGAIFDVTLEVKHRDLVVHLEPSKMFAFLHDRFVERYDGAVKREAYFNTLRAKFKNSDENLLDFGTVDDLDTAAFSTLPQRVERSRYVVGLDSKLTADGTALVTKEEWREVLEPFVASNETDRIAVLTRSETFVRKVGELWSATGVEGMHIFLSWCVVQIAAPYANQQLQLNFYGSKERSQLVQDTSCLARAFLIAGTEVFHGYHELVLPSRIQLVVHMLIRSVCRAFLLRLRQWEHFDADVTVLQERDTAELPWHVVHASFVEGEDTAGDMTDSLVDNWRNAPVPHAVQEPLRSDLYSAIEDAQPFVLLDRDFALMPYALTFPHFDGDATAALNYAGIGSITALALGKLFMAAYGASVEGVATLLSSHHGTGKELANATASDDDQMLMLRAVATSTSFYAYDREWASRDAMVKGLEGYSGAEVFFMASCYALCSGTGEEYDNGEACNAHLRHVDQFASTFNCAPGTPMNPEIQRYATQ
ncbi:hypothetical protein HPB49_021659 [Dermacentor silvarum]|uniref:Uncharacterized protein n=1 Tax=Dermacentor silvarum TaxID=543639 RepID=A0ACB8CZN9_DERSI|nr:hypothetical protein HPB49_021659 [Dermacentor silvarum]